MTWLPKQRIVVPIDFSEISFTAVDTAVQLVDKPSHVTVVHVLEDISPVQPGALWNTLDRWTRVKHTIEVLEKQLKDQGHENVSVDVRIGAAAQEIIASADHAQAELIVMTSHGRTGLSHLLIGSVAERVTRLAHCPVLILRD